MLHVPDVVLRQLDGLDSDGAPYTADEDEDLSGPSWDPDRGKPWNSQTTRVISGPLGTRASFRGGRFLTWQDAKAYVQSKYQLVNFGCIPGRWIARIKK